VLCHGRRQKDKFLYRIVLLLGRGSQMIVCPGAIFIIALFIGVVIAAVVVGGLRTALVFGILIFIIVVHVH